jgi:hypothetical protein
MRTSNASKMGKTSQSPSKMGFNSPSKSGIKIFKPNFEQASAVEDTIDPIYENKDPISVSIKQRCEVGTFLSVKKSAKAGPTFFFQMELTGPGA